MAEKYFTKFPDIVYNNQICKDITRRVIVKSIPRSNPNLFYPLELESDFRSDALAEAYYQDSEVDWLIYLTNQIIDPYYGWYLGQEDFKQYITDKYGSPEWADKHIAFYRNNWYRSEQEIPVSSYNNHLAWDLKKYWSPIYGVKNQIISFKRKQVDWNMNTNRIERFPHSGPAFANGELVDFKKSGEIVGSGEVISSNDSVVDIQHISGNTHANTTYRKDIVGETSNNVVEVKDRIVLQINITDAEAVYWDKVTYMDLELEANESKKQIQIIDDRYAFDVAEEIRVKLKE